VVSEVMKIPVNFPRVLQVFSSFLMILGTSARLLHLNLHESNSLADALTEVVEKFDGKTKTIDFVSSSSFISKDFQDISM
jgi:hypothetical protein